MGTKKGEGKAARPSFSLRLQPHENSLLAEVVHYLNSIGRSDAQRQVENVLVMALVAQARLYDESRSEEERRRCCIESCDALEKHASMLRQLVGVERQRTVHSDVDRADVAAPTVQRSAALERLMEKVSLSKVKADAADAGEVGEEAEMETETETERVPPKSRIEGKATAAEANSLFGD